MSLISELLQQARSDPDAWRTFRAFIIEILLELQIVREINAPEENTNEPY